MGYNIDTGGKGVLHDKISLKNGFWPQFFAMVVRNSGNLNKKVCWIFLHIFLKKSNSHSLANKLCLLHAVYLKDI